MTGIDLQALAELYGFAEGALTANPAGGNWNESFLFDFGSRGFVLRVGPPDQDAAELTRALGFQESLADLGSPVVRPVRSRRGRLVEVLPAPGNRLRPVSVLERFPGEGRDTLAKGELPDEAFAAIGRALARLHEDARTLDAPGDPLPDWYKRENCFNIPGLPWFADREIVDAYFRHREACRTGPETADTWGPVHGDIHFSNILVDPRTGAVSFCDLDDACRGPFRMDLALIAFDLGVILNCEDRDREALRLIRILLEGYNEGRAGSTISLSDLTKFIKLLEASLYIQCFEKYDGNPKGWVGRFFRDRRRRVVENLPWPP